LFFALGAQAQTDAVLTPIGGGGGGQFSARCPQGRHLIGFELRTGDDVDAIRPLCAVAHSPREAGPVEPYPNSFGGDGGGDMRQLVCPGAAPVVTGMYVGYEGKTTVVNNIHLVCGVAAETQTSSELQSAVFNGPAYVGPSNSFKGEPGHGDQRCPAGLVAVGISGRSGTWLDAVGLICGVPRLTRKPGTPAPAPPAKPKTPVSLGKVNVALPAFLYGVAPDGTLKWFRHEGANVGSFDLEGPRSVNVGWANFKQVTAGGEGVIYAVTRQGALMLFRHAGFGEGLGRDDAAAWLPPQEIATGWGNFTQIFSGGDGVIYAVTPEGKLRWYRHTGFINGRATLDGPREVGRGWGGLRHVFSMGDGVIYTITPDGKLRWYRHVAHRTGGGLETQGSWEGGREVGHGWEGLRQVFAAGRGVIYAVTPDGKLWWYRHRGYRTGRGFETPGSWEARKSISNDWGNFVQAFAQ